MIDPEKSAASSLPDDYKAKHYGKESLEFGFDQRDCGQRDVVPIRPQSETRNQLFESFKSRLARNHFSASYVSQKVKTPTQEVRQLGGIGDGALRKIRS
jgi:hypothetical protein